MFLGESLDKRVKNLYDKKDKFKNFPNMRKQFGYHMDILCRKGFYPYEWVDSIDKLNYIGIPPAEVFHSQLNMKALYMMQTTRTRTRKKTYRHKREPRPLYNNL